MRVRLSMVSRNAAPSTAAIGTSFRWSGPTRIRAMWGITRPTQPIAPLCDTAVAVIAVAQTMAISRVRCALAPSDRASASPIVSRFSCQVITMSTASPTTMMGAAKARFSHRIPDREPISQKVIAGRSSSGSARYFMIETPALKIELTTTPDSTSMIVGVMPFTLASA